MPAAISSYEPVIEHVVRPAEEHTPAAFTPVEQVPAAVRAEAPAEPVEPIRQREPSEQRPAATASASDSTIVQAMQAHAPSPSYEAPRAPTPRAESRVSAAPTSATDLRQTVEQSGMVWIETDPSKVVVNAPVEESESAQPRQRRDRKPRANEEVSLVQIETRKD